MEPLTPLETLCRIILRAKEYEAQVPTDYDGGEAPENVDDESEGVLSVLDDSINDSVEKELIASFEDLAEDQQAELLAFAWIGQGTYDAAGGTKRWRGRGENNIVESCGNADARLSARGRPSRVRHQLRQDRRP
jgi:hypothetical protein